MSLADVESRIQKSMSNIAKLGKAELADKTKAAFLKDVVATLKKADEWEKKRVDLNKKIKEAKTLQADIDKYVKEHTAFIKDAVKVAQQQSKIGADTKGRDYFMIATNLEMVGQGVLDDYP